MMTNQPILQWRRQL